MRGGFAAPHLLYLSNGDTVDWTYTNGRLAERLDKDDLIDEIIEVFSNY